MKSIYETFTDKEFQGLSGKKGIMSWHDFILKSAGVTLDD